MELLEHAALASKKDTTKIIHLLKMRRNRSRLSVSVSIIAFALVTSTYHEKILKWSVIDKKKKKKIKGVCVIIAF